MLGLGPCQSKDDQAVATLKTRLRLKANSKRLMIGTFARLKKRRGWKRRGLIIETLKSSGGIL